MQSSLVDVAERAHPIPQAFERRPRLIGENADAPNPLPLLRARRERPRDCCAAERGYHFPPSDSDRHVALPCEGWLVKGTISRRKRAVFTPRTAGPSPT